ncbi:MAG: type II and III secretion system protein [Methylomonas lenta]|nr:type II and III secretion system protein [Methylomonas lenta]
MADTVMEVIPLHNRPSEEIQPLLTPLLEDGDIINSSGFNLIVKTSPERLENFRSLVEKLDTRRHNLMISVLQNSHKTAEQLNAEAAILIAPPAIRMRGMVADTRNVGRQNTAQQIRTLEGQAAHIQTGQQRPIENVTVYDSGYGYPGVVSNQQLQESSSGFAAIPHLINQNEIVIDLAPWSDQFLNNGGLATQSIDTSVRTRLGEWVEIGGTVNQQQSNNQGYTGLNHTTQNQSLRIMLKVELAD